MRYIVLALVVTLVACGLRPMPPDACAMSTCQRLLQLSEEVDFGSVANDDELYKRLRAADEQARCAKDSTLREQTQTMLQAMRRNEPDEFDRAIKHAMTVCERVGIDRP